MVSLAWSTAWGAHTPWVVRNGVLYEPAAGGKENRIVQLENGRLLTWREQTQGGVTKMVYAELRPETFTALMEAYSKPGSYNSMALKNPENKARLEQIAAQKPPYLLEENGLLYEVVNGQKNVVFELEDGHLVTAQKEYVRTKEGARTRAYRSINPTVLAQLMERYGKDPEKNHSILNNAYNQEDLKRTQARNYTNEELDKKDLAYLAKREQMLRPFSAEASKVIPVAQPKKPEALRKGVERQYKGLLFKSEVTPRPGYRLGSIGYGENRVFREVPQWVGEKDTARYFEAEAEAHEHFPPLKQAGLSEEYRNLYQAYVDAATGSEFSHAEEKQLAEIAASDNLHLFWAKRLKEVGGVDKLSPEERERYKADLVIFEVSSVALRALRKYDEIYERNGKMSKAEWEEEVRRDPRKRQLWYHDENGTLHIPKFFLKVKGLTMEEEDAKNAEALREVVDRFKNEAPDFTLNRLEELSRKTYVSTKTGEQMLEYPKLAAYVLGERAKQAGTPERIRNIFRVRPVKQQRPATHK